MNSAAATATRTSTYEVTAPWSEPATDEEAIINRKLRSISNYQYESLWQPIEVTSLRKQQLAKHRLVPPFETSDAILQEPSKHLNKVNAANHTKTLAPWEHGGEAPSPSCLKAYFDQPRTELWPVPEVKKSTVESSGDPVLDNLRNQLSKFGADGIHGLGRKFRIMDDDSSGSLDMAEFTKAMRECELVDLSKKAIEHIFRYLDADDSGQVSFDEFLVGIRGVMNSRRKAIVQAAFDVLDKDGSGVVDLKDVRGVYKVHHHPDYIAGKKTEEELLIDFLSNFKSPRSRGNFDGSLDRDDFEQYYRAISASIDDDDYFELVVRNAWHISGGVGSCANSSNRRVLVTREDGSQYVEERKDDMRRGSSTRNGA